MPITAAHDVQHCRGEITVHCTRKGIKGHIVPRDKMTVFYTEKGIKLPICVDCKQLMDDRKKGL